MDSTNSNVNKINSDNENSIMCVLDRSDHRNNELCEKLFIEIPSPIIGEAVAISEVDDKSFASELLGKSVAIIPSVGEVLAPEDCTIVSIHDALHAIEITLYNGVELMIHVGIGTVKLQGEYFRLCVKEGQKVKRGTLLICFDIHGIKAAGYDTITPVVVLNSNQYERVERLTGEVDNDKKLILLQ